MTFKAGTKLGTYDIVGPLGSGGMGEVYRARDSKLKREVAIKVLPDVFSRDVERLLRFQREAEILASLNHPQIAAIYDLAEFDGSRFLVLELVEGETLADRISRGPIPIEDSLAIAKQIAEALEGAHEKGIIHRDLKPANIKFTRDGVVKVLDFGLAKARASSIQANNSNSPTLMTEPALGTVMGTPAYMSPEQAKGQDVDRTTDVWAFGCVLFEMLTGRMVFEGDTTTEILGGVLKSEPNWRLLPPDTPEGLRRLLRRCLQKDRKPRLHDIADARIDIEELQDEPQTNVDVFPATPRRNARFVWIAAASVLILAGVVAAVQLRLPASSPERRVEITTPPTLDPLTLAISPDGEKVVFVANSGGRSMLTVRFLASGVVRPLPGTDYAQYPFWSPNSRSLGFFAGGKLNRIDVDGGAVQTLTNAQAGIGGSWNADGTILFATSTGRPISRISEKGGDAIDVTKVVAPQTTHRFPQFLPDGRHFIYYVTGSAAVRGIHMGQTDGSPGRRLLDTDTLAVYEASGHLLFVREGTLVAQAFDPERPQLIGDSFPVAENVAVNSRVAGELALSASSTGSIVYRSVFAAGHRLVEWFDRSGKLEGNLGGDVEGFSPAVSPDFRRVALYRTISGNQDIWWFDLGRKAGGLRFTLDPSGDNSPIWSQDGNRILFSTNRTGIRSILDGLITAVAGSEKLFLQTDQNIVPLDWAPDGTLLFRSNDPKTNFDIWAMPPGKGKAFPVVRTSFEEREAQFSPDGKWIAYQSNETGRFEIYLQPFPGPGTKLPISNNGGAQVRWRGNEVFYIGLDGQLRAVRVRVSSDGNPEADAPVPLFFTRIVGGPVQATDPQQYTVDRDGRRFLMSTVSEVDNSPIELILNWKAKH